MNYTIKHIVNPIYGFTKCPNSFYNLTINSRSEAGLVNFISGADRGQAMLLPSMVEDYIAADAAVRVIDAFVDSLDVLALGFERPTPAPLEKTRRRTESPNTSRPPKIDLRDT